MKVLDLINRNLDNWEDIVMSAPYKLTIKKHDPYVLLQYNMIESDLSLDEVCESRGSIFCFNGREYECVCYPFVKFFNDGEVHAADIDWETAIVTEKIDGSLMKLWYHNDSWHLSTNGTINAYEAMVNGNDFSFGDMFDKALGQNALEWADRFLNKSLTYLFELVSPETRVVLSYTEAKVYYLTSFNPASEMEVYDLHMKCLNNVWFPEVFPLKNKYAVTDLVQGFDNREGVVVADMYSNRIKIKSPAYLVMHHMVNNGQITKKRMLEMLLNEVTDDFLAYFPDYISLYAEVMADFSRLSFEMYASALFYLNGDYTPKAMALAMTAEEKRYSGYLFKKLRGNSISPVEYLKDLGYKKVAELLNY